MHQPLFKVAYVNERAITDRIIKAASTFERTIVSRKSLFDKFTLGYSTQLNNKEIQGLLLFRNKADCLNYRNSHSFSDN